MITNDITYIYIYISRVYIYIYINKADERIIMMFPMEGDQGCADDVGRCLDAHRHVRCTGPGGRGARGAGPMADPFIVDLPMKQWITGWCFGTWLLCFHILGIIIPID